MTQLSVVCTRPSPDCGGGGAEERGVGVNILHTLIMKKFMSVQRFFLA